MKPTEPTEPRERTGDDEPPRFVEFVDAEPSEPFDDEESAGITGGVLIRGFAGIGYALATVDELTGVWYLARGTALGNPIRTRNTSTAMIWPDPGSLCGYVDRFPDRIKADLARRLLFIVPVKLQIVFNGEFERLTITTRAAPVDPADPDAAPVVEFELGTAPLPRRRKRKRRRWTPDAGNYGPGMDTHEPEPKR